MFRKVESGKGIVRLSKRVKYNWQKRCNSSLPPSPPSPLFLIESCHISLRRDTLGYLRSIFGGAEMAHDRCKEIRNVHLTSDWKIRIVNSSVIFTNICSFRAYATGESSKKKNGRQKKERYIIFLSEQFVPHYDVCKLRWGSRSLGAWTLTGTPVGPFSCKQA